MKFTFTEKKMESSEDLRTYSIRKIGKLDRFFKTEADAYVTFSIERGRFLAEITIHNNGMYYRASELTSDMYASVDSGVAAIERQIRRNKTRLEKRLREGALERDARCGFRRSSGRAGRGVQDRPQQALLHKAHVPGGGDTSDEPAWARVLCVQEYGL